MPRTPGKRPDGDDASDEGRRAHADAGIALPRIAEGTRDDVSFEARAALSSANPSANASASANAMIEEFTVVVHDLKNPLAVIALEAALLAERLGPDGPAPMRRGLQRIAQNVGYIDRLVSDVLDLGCIDNDALELHADRTDLARLLGSALDRGVSTLERPRVRVAIIDRPFVIADALRIERVISNLVGNALKYTPFGSQVAVRLEVDGDRARITVIDAGPGLSAADAHAVFERYRRAGAARGRPGHGLGLYVSRQIVEAHGGSIGVTSTAGHGAQFWFELPTVP